MILFFLVLFVHYIHPSSSYITHFRKNITAEVVQISGDGSTIVTFQRRGQPTPITIFKQETNQTYTQIIIQNYLGYVPPLSTIFPAYENGRNQLYQQGFYNMNKPVLNFDGSLLYFIKGDTRQFLKVSLSATTIQNPSLYLMTNYSSYCQAPYCLFTVQRDNYLSVFDLNLNKLTILNSDIVVFNRVILTNSYGFVKYAGLKISSNYDFWFSIYVNQSIKTFTIYISSNSYLYLNENSTVYSQYCYYVTYYYWVDFNLCTRVSDSLRENTYYSRSFKGKQYSNGFIFYTMDAAFIDDNGNMSGSRVVTYLSFVQVSESRQYIAYAFEYNNQYLIQVVRFNNNTRVISPDVKITQKARIGCLAISSNSSKIVYSIPSSQQLVLVENKQSSITPQPTQPATNTTQSTKTTEPIGIAALVLTIIIIVAFIVGAIIYKVSKYRKQKNKQKQTQQGQIRNTTLGNIKLQNIETICIPASNTPIKEQIKQKSQKQNKGRQKQNQKKNKLIKEQRQISKPKQSSMMEEIKNHYVDQKF